MLNKNAVKENQARRRLMRFSLLTLGGAGMEGNTQRVVREEQEERHKTQAVMAA